MASGVARCIVAFILPSVLSMASFENSTTECDAGTLIQTVRRSQMYETWAQKQQVYVTWCRFELAPEEEVGSGPLFGVCTKKGENPGAAAYYILDEEGTLETTIPPVPWLHVFLKKAAKPPLDDGLDPKPPWADPRTVVWHLVNVSIAGPTSDLGELESPTLEGSWAHNSVPFPFVVSSNTATYRGRTYKITYKISPTGEKDSTFAIDNFGGGGGSFDASNIRFNNGEVFKKLQKIPQGMYYSVAAGSGIARVFCQVDGTTMTLETGEVYTISTEPDADWSFPLTSRSGVVTKGNYSYEATGQQVTKEVLEFAGHTVQLGPNLTGLWETDGGTMNISFSTVSQGNVSVSFWLPSLDGSRMEFSSSELGGSSANFRLKSDSRENYAPTNTLYFSGGWVYKKLDEPLSVTTLFRDGMYYRGSTPYALKSGEFLTTADGRYKITHIEFIWNTFALSDDFGGGGGRFTDSSIVLENGYNLALGSNLNGFWNFRGHPMIEISFGTLIYRSTRRFTLTVPKTHEMSIENNFGSGSAVYDDKYYPEVIDFANKVRITRTTTTTTTTETPKEMDILMVICKFKDSSPHYINEESAMTGLFDGLGSVRDIINASTFGRVTVSRENSQAVTIEMNRAWEDVVGCPYRELGDEAIELVRAKGINPDNFTFREFFLPRQPGNGGCLWAGIANVGCGHPSALPNKGGCRLYYRYGLAYVRAHELGHSLGLRHAGGEKNGRYVEYGDDTVLMGNSYTVSSYSAPAIFQIGGLKIGPGEVVEWNSTGTKRLFSVQTISEAKNATNADAIAVRVFCPLCVPRVARQATNVGGWLWVSFRGHDGYSAFRLQPKWQDKVYIHLARAYSSRFFGQGTELWASLGSHEAYSVNGFSFYVCKLSGSIAEVAMGVDEADAQKSCT
eukprot:TRINITY_DN75608_c0_g1_i1.p1 TRINITY_DN75608_c0_g1~~TRINITY_DN75608_c0_g1_i1.p1  ORF type:complete len:903 (-),score=83.77 TRINITY_DN75608_c0_g1_i1:279-2987(-)